MAMASGLRLCVSRVLRLNLNNDLQHKVAASIFSQRSLSSKPADTPFDTVTVDSSQKETRGRDIDNPVLVASTTSKCIVGCSCSEEHPTLKWFFLEDGPVSTCECGYYFKLDRVSDEQWIPDHARVMAVDKSIPDPRVARRGMPFADPTKQNKMEKVS